MKSILIQFSICLCLVQFINEVQAEDSRKQSEQIIFFENQVRPILVKRCFSCHGKKKQHAELRIDSKKRILKGGESGPSIVPFHPEKSLLIESVNRESFEMPPDEELPKKEIEVLIQWIKEGAVWPESLKNEEENSVDKFRQHWSFRKISNPKIPDVQKKSWPNNAIDHFILARLEINQLSPSPEADKETLIKRIKWDLTGLPVSLKESTDYQKSPQISSTTDLINHYLESPHYGERWGRYWLDLARYADTKGYVFFEKPIFRNGFTYRDYVIKSFNEDKPYNQFLLEQIAADQLEGIPQESQAALGFITIGARFKNDIDDIMSDRIDVVSRGLLGLTVGCARCHDHKYDPVSMEDYYSLYGIFRNSVQPLNMPFRLGNHLSEQHKKQAEKIEKTAVELDQFLRNKYSQTMKDGLEKLGEYLKAAQSKRSGPNTVMFDVIVDNGDLIPELLLIWQRYLTDSEKNKSPLFLPWNVLAKLPKEDFSKQAKIILKEMKTKNGEGKTKFNQIIWTKLVSADLKSFDDVVQVYEKEIKLAQTQWLQAQSEKPETNNITSVKNPDSEELRQVVSGYGSPLKVPYHYFRVLGLFPDRESQKKVKELNQALDKIRANAPVELAQMLVLKDAKDIIEPRVFKRGNAAKPAQQVERRYIRFFTEVHDKPFQNGSGRLELAQAIVSPNNPLTARVIVNRVWQQHFGQGLVRTVSDFGIQGSKPSHPLLLDHLASWFMQHNWSIKRLHLYIMESATYRQQSLFRNDGEKRDPENRLCWRMNRRRQDFETMRDSLLAVSHQLDRKIGGPSVKGIMSDNNKRRTLYTFLDRQQVPGIYRTFDFPPPDVSSGDRTPTIVPGQTLFLMNHPMVLSCAKILAEKAESLEDPAKGIESLYQNILARKPTLSETAEMLSYLQADYVPEEVVVKNQWQYGFGSYDLKTEKLLSFTELTHWTGNQFQGSETLPDKQLGWIFLNSTGGHPGNDMNHVAVLRWIAPESMTVSIKGILKHEKPKGNGIRARIIASRQKILGPWSLHQKSVETNQDKYEIQKGDSIDFIVDINDNLSYDSFVWSPEIKMISLNQKISSTGTEEKPVRNKELKKQVWNYGKDFQNPGKTKVTSWMNMAQVLLISNEFQFVD